MRVVILSGATTPRSGVAAQSKDPLRHVLSNDLSRHSHSAPRAFDFDLGQCGSDTPVRRL